MTDQDNFVFDRLAFLISGVPGFEECKLFSVPAILDGTSLQVFEIVEDCGLFENISALCFDTTTSNIEWKNCDRVQLENHLFAFQWRIQDSVLGVAEVIKILYHSDECHTS
ncbi:hypothetical protein AVEN_37552-1 [Araneus ventricosus]|uniref:Uncharacterized protein n=1 Tax=Araneus ventricosus TaxID=182803 RepID=A0A4Y1ZIZ8_ARAVE|nr:hypothetical protein AVEN_37552-1 [Araneus ventricosus]